MNPPTPETASPTPTAEVTVPARVEPRLPPGWPGYSATVRLGSRVYRVRVARGAAGPQVTVEEDRQGEKAGVL